MARCAALYLHKALSQSLSAGHKPIILIVSLYEFRGNARNNGHRRAIGEVVGKLVEFSGFAAGQDFDVAVGEVDSVTRDAEGFGNAAGALTEKHALDPAPDRKSTRHGHRAAQSSASRAASLTRSASMAAVLAATASRRATP